MHVVIYLLAILDRHGFPHGHLGFEKVLLWVVQLHKLGPIAGRVYLAQLNVDFAV